MKILPFWLPELASRERANIELVLEQNFLNEGRHTTEFENRLAALLQVPHAVALTNCTSALYLSLYALGVRPGDEVLIPDVTFVATASAVTMTGARPVLVDVDENLMIDLAKARILVNERTRAIVPVHVSGRPVPMDNLLAFAQEHQLAVVEDAAEALLSKYKGRYLGTLGQAGCFSFSPNKTITMGQGGVVVTHDPELARRLRELKDQGRPVKGTGGDDNHEVVGFNFKLTNLQAAVGLAQLDVLETRTERLCGIRREYLEGLGGLPRLTFPAADVGTVPQWVDVIIDQGRDELVAFLETQGISCRKFWHPVHSHSPYRAEDSAYPMSSRLVPRSFWLPSAFQMTSADVAEVCGKVREFLAR